MGRIHLRALALVLLVASMLVAVVPVRAASNDWTPLGPPSLDHLWNFVVDRQTPSTLYAVSMHPGQGIRKSSDGGLTWQWLDLDAPGELYDVHLFVLDPTHSDTLYAGLDYYVEVERIVHKSLLKSTDGGDSWKPITNGLPSSPGLDDDVSVVQLAVDPQTPNTLYATIYDQGLYKSTDGGTSWSPSGNGLPASDYVNWFAWGETLLIDPQTPSTIYLVVAREGVFKSMDAGATWKPTNTGLPVELVYEPDGKVGQAIYVQWIAPDPKIPTTLYVGTDRGMYMSTDAAASWQPLSQEGLPSDSDGRIHVFSLNIDPVVPQTLLATALRQYGPNEERSELYRSIDGGASWVQVTTPPVFSGNLIVKSDGQTPQTLFLFVQDAGLLYRSADGGETWEYLASGSLSGVEISSLAVNPHDPAKLYAGVKRTGLSRSQNRGRSWTPVDGFYPPAGIREIVVDPLTPEYLYAATDSGLLASRDDGDSWQPLGVGLPTDAVARLFIDPETPTRFYAQGAIGVLRSEDRGETWIIANAGLPLGYGSAPAVHSLTLDPQTPNTLYAIAATKRDNIYATCAHKSADGARTWAEICKGIPRNEHFFSQLLVDRQVPSTLYLLEPYWPRLYRSDNGGDSWFAIAPQVFPTSPNLPHIEELAVDPSRNGVLYANTTDNGFYSSVDGGDNWYSLTAGLPKDAGDIGAPVVDPTVIGRVYLPTDNGIYTADLSATLTVDVVVFGTSPTEGWTLTGPKGDFVLPAAGGSHAVGQLELGAYDVSITPQADYTMQSVCTQGLGYGEQATAHAAAGQDVVCTFYASAPDAPRSRLPVIGR